MAYSTLLYYEVLFTLLLKRQLLFFLLFLQYFVNETLSAELACDNTLV